MKPTTLGSQFKSHALAYGTGAVMLGGFQFAMNRIDWLAKAAVEAIFGPEPDKAWRPAAFILGLAILAFVTRVASRLLVFNAGRDIEYELRKLLLERLHTLGTAFYRKMSAGEIMSRATNDLQQVRLLFGFGVLNLVNVVFAFASAMQVMLSISVLLTLGCLANLPLIVLISRWVSRAMFVRTRENQQSLGALSDCVQGNLAGVRVVRSFALEDRERLRFDGVNDRYLHASLALARVRVLGPMLGAASGIGIIVFFWYGSHLVLQGSLTSGAFYAFWQAFARMTWPMLALGFAITMIQRGRAGYSRLKDVFDARPEVVDGPLPAPAQLGGSLKIEGLTFAYGARTVLDGVDFDLPEGASLAILGRTGSGKSTLAMLLARLLPTPSGTVRIDGHDVCDLPLASVRTAIGYAQQDAFLFSTTVSRNIGFSLDDPDAPDSLQKIRGAAREAQVLEETLGLPEQFDTVVGERGVQLSGGQKQRIALARALVWEPKILILDDPLSAVDAKTEAAILDAIDRQAEKRTVVLITHRVAAAARCDSILVLDHGRVIERGTHDKLVHAGGLYAAFAEEQRMATELEALAVDDAELTPPPARAEGGPS